LRSAIWHYTEINCRTVRTRKDIMECRKLNVTVLTWICCRIVITSVDFWMFTLSGYSAGLRAVWPGVGVPAAAGNFYRHHRVQIGCGAHPGSYPMGTRDSYLGGKAAGAWSWLPTPSTEVKEWAEMYLHSPITPSWRGALLEAQGQLYLLWVLCLFNDTFIGGYWIMN
jgi:hypothetical protein